MGFASFEFSIVVAMAESSGCLGFEVDQKTHAATDIHRQCSSGHDLLSTRVSDLCTHLVRAHIPLQ